MQANRYRQLLQAQIYTDSNTVASSMTLLLLSLFQHVRTKHVAFSSMEMYSAYKQKQFNSTLKSTSGKKVRLTEMAEPEAHDNSASLRLLWDLKLTLILSSFAPQRQVPQFKS